MFINSPWRLGSAIDSINNLNYIGVWDDIIDNINDPFLQTNHTLYKFVQKLIYFRKSCISIRRGNLYVRYASQNNGGLFIFSRIYENIEIIIVINPNDSISQMIPNQILIDNTINANYIGKKYYNALWMQQYAWIGKGILLLFSQFLNLFLFF